jgi:hypothetical protein
MTCSIAGICSKSADCADRHCPGRTEAVLDAARRRGFVAPKPFHPETPEPEGWSLPALWIAAIFAVLFLAMAFGLPLDLPFEPPLTKGTS